MVNSIIDNKTRGNFERTVGGSKGIVILYIQDLYPWRALIVRLISLVLHSSIVETNPQSTTWL